MKRTLQALDRIQSRLENELDSTPATDEKGAGYRSGISEALAHVREVRKTFAAGE